MKIVFPIIFSFFLLFAKANKPASEIYVGLQKLQSLKRVLYIAAHPDDENTRALAWFSLGEHAQTAYLSLTRGDGGQNLIGNELSEQLGVLRTQELLAARLYDGANQYFTRAVDFGYSKSAEESLEKWGNDEILSDVVLMIRKFKPDVIVTRFPPDKRAGHGHHTASAMLALEAFDKAADENFLPLQVKEFGTWKTTSVYWNSSVWWFKDLPAQAENNPEYLIADIGGYNAHLGKSYNEIGTIARSQHKCQGFGAITERGSRLEYFQYLKGDKLSNSFFEKNKRSWSKLLNKEFEQKIDNLVKGFDFSQPENNVAELLEIRNELLALPNSDFKNEKIGLCNQLILDCTGVYAELLAKDFIYQSNDSAFFELELLNRSNLAVSVILKNQTIKLEQNQNFARTLKVENSNQISNPYWLTETFSTLFQVKNQKDLLQPESCPSFVKKIKLLIEKDTVRIPLVGTYKWRIPSYGEKRRYVIKTPDFSANFDQKLLVVKPGFEKKLKLNIHSFRNNLSDKITINAPQGWEVLPKSIDVAIDKLHEEKWVELTLKPTDLGKSGILKLMDSKGNQLYSYTEIAYDHIPTQVIFSKAEINCVKLDAKIKPGKIAYIKGAEDIVPEAIEQLGFEVTRFEVSDLSSLDLSQFQSVVLGIRIYNVQPELKNFEEKLFAYVKAGGNLVMQYNTASRRASGETFGPIPFELTRKRVTEEDAEVNFLEPKHPIMTTPNKLTKKDFDNWVQERGLYFAGNWHESYIPLFSWADKGEEEQKGALIVTKHGKGQFVYTGISFFRELPNGVEGAYKLFANILSY
ncbi:MAG: PIG-L family deacetylase [Flavobacteriales bacterium]|jgi:LmbE family N-acetylglucosaminyl deacetylase